jgi:hypothetical protein
MLGEELRHIIDPPDKYVKRDQKLADNVDIRIDHRDNKVFNLLKRNLSYFRKLVRKA